MFKDVFKNFEQIQLPYHLSQFDTITDDQIKQAIYNPNNSIEKFIALLSDKALDYIEEIAQASHAITNERFGKTIQLYAPLYFSSECSNKCTYCSFSMDNDIVRKTLTFEELHKEAIHLKKIGFQHVLLVSGEDRKVITNEYISECIRRCKEVFPSVTIEIAPQDIKEYELFANSGCEGVTVYQETYDRVAYKQHHVAGKKRLFDYRIDTADRACQAGMRNIAIGALFGLSSWKIEALSLFTHLKYLQKKYWRTHFSVAFPRLRDHVGTYHSSDATNLVDSKLAQLVCAFRLCFHDTGIVLSTRENPEFRDSMLPLGITRMSAGSSTEVGGYTGEVTPNEPQFQIEDLRPASEVYKRIKELGYDPIWKDWEGTMYATK